MSNEEENEDEVLDVLYAQYAIKWKTKLKELHILIEQDSYRTNETIIIGDEINSEPQISTLRNVFTNESTIQTLLDDKKKYELEKTDGQRTVLFVFMPSDDKMKLFICSPLWFTKQKKVETKTLWESLVSIFS